MKTRADHLRKKDPVPPAEIQVNEHSKYFEYSKKDLPPRMERLKHSQRGNEPRGDGYSKDVSAHPTPKANDSEKEVKDVSNSQAKKYVDKDIESVMHLLDEKMKLDDRKGNYGAGRGGKQSDNWSDRNRRDFRGKEPQDGRFKDQQFIKDQQFNGRRDQQYRERKDQPFNARNDQPFNARKDQQSNARIDQQSNERKDQQGNERKDQQSNARKEQQLNGRKDQHSNERKDQPLNARKDQQSNARKDQQSNERKDQQSNERKDQPLNARKDPQSNARKDQQSNERKDQQYNERKDQQKNPRASDKRDFYNSGARARDDNRYQNRRHNNQEKIDFEQNRGNKQNPGRHEQATSDSKKNRNGSNVDEKNVESSGTKLAISIVGAQAIERQSVTGEKPLTESWADQVENKSQIEDSSCDHNEKVTTLECRIDAACLFLNFPPTPQSLLRPFPRLLVLAGCGRNYSMDLKNCCFQFLRFFF